MRKAAVVLCLRDNKEMIRYVLEMLALSPNSTRRSSHNTMIHVSVFCRMLLPRSRRLQDYRYFLYHVLYMIVRFAHNVFNNIRDMVNVRSLCVDIRVVWRIAVM